MIQWGLGFVKFSGIKLRMLTFNSGMALTGHESGQVYRIIGYKYNATPFERSLRQNV